MYVYSSKKVQGVAFLIFLIDTTKPIIYTYNLMTQNKNQKIIIYSDGNNLYGHALSRFLPTCGFKWIDLTEFDINKNTSNRSKGCVLEVNLEYLKELLELHLMIL